MRFLPKINVETTRRNKSLARHVLFSVFIKRGQKWASGSSGQAGISKKVPSDLKLIQVTILDVGLNIKLRNQGVFGQKWSTLKA